MLVEQAEFVKVRPNEIKNANGSRYNNILMRHEPLIPGRAVNYHGDYEFDLLWDQAY